MNKYLVFQELAIDIFTSSSFCNFGNIAEKKEIAHASARAVEHASVLTRCV